MASNIIQKIIKLILDKKSAEDAENQTKETTGKIDAAWKEMATKVAGYLGLAFLTKKVVEFGRECIDQATASQDAWSELEGSVDAVGGSFDKLESKLRLQADAFQAATIHDDDAYAVSLGRLVSLTGDVAASTNNMGFVANVAAKFFKGDLAPATDLVGKVMNGNTAILGRMGIQVKSVQEGLEVLASRSMGAAEKRAATFTGQIAQLRNGFDDFKKGIGEALIQSDGAASGLDVLRAVVQKLNEWIGRNKETISQWVTKGINFAIDAADVLFRAVHGMATLLAGGFQAGIGVAAKGLAILARGYVTATNAASAFLDLIGADEKSEALDQHAGAILAQANAIDAWADAAIKAGSDKVMKGVNILGTPVFSSKDFAKGGPRASAGPAKLDFQTPVAGMNADLTDAEKAWQKFDEAIAHAKATVSGANAELDFLAAQAAAIEELMKGLTTATGGSDEALGFLASSLKGVNAQIEEAKKLEVLRQTLEDFDREAMAAAATADPFATRLQKLSSEADRLRGEIQKLISAGMDPLDKSLVARIDRLGQVNEAIKAETASMQFQQQVAADLAQALFASFGSGLGPYARMKSKQLYLEATEAGIRSLLSAIFGNPAGAAANAGAALKFAALGAAWSALASVNGGGGGGAAPPTSSTGTNPGSSLGSSRASSSSSSRNAAQPTPITEIHFVGPGFTALNPEVQKVVRGAEREAIERAGNVRVRVVRS